MILKNKLFALLLLLFIAVSAQEFTSSFNEQIKNIYDQKYKAGYSNSMNDRGWNKIISVYSELYNIRLQKEVNRSEILEKIDGLIDDIDDGNIKGLSDYEAELIKGTLYGSMAYVMSEDPSLSMFRRIRKSQNIFEDLHKKFKTLDTEFGLALSEIAIALYFQDSFWVRSVLGYDGSIIKGIKSLNEIALKGAITRVEANLFLIEYYSLILNDHNSSKIYSKNLHEQYPESNHFKFLYAKDLYHTGKIKQAQILFEEINRSITDTFYAYNYNSIIYEAQCLYILGNTGEADEVIKLASNIHDGYILEKFRNEWKSSIKLRQEAIYRIQNAIGTDTNLSEDELKRTALVMFDHGYFREVNQIVGNMNSNDIDILVLNFRTSVIMQDWKKAERLISDLDKIELFETHPDRKRILLLRNIVLNYTE